MREPSRVGTRGASPPIVASTCPPSHPSSHLHPMCSSSSIWGNGNGPLHDPQPHITPPASLHSTHLPTTTFPALLSLLGLPAPELSHSPEELCHGLPAPCPPPSPKIPFHALHPCNAHMVSQPLITTSIPSKLPHTPKITPQGLQPSLLTLDQRQTSCLGRGSSGGSRFSLLGGRKAAGGRCRAPPAPSGRKNWKELGRPSM